MNKAGDQLDVIYLDESWIFGRGSKRKSRQDDSILFVKNKPAGERKRFIVLSAGGSQGYVPNSSLIFVAKSTTGDYHGEMNADTFHRWLKEQLLPNLSEPSLIVMDSAPYHSKLQDKLPSTAWSKAQLREFLHEWKLEFGEHMFKPELYSLAKGVRTLQTT